MTETRTTHPVDVSIRSRIHQAAQARLKLVREKERRLDGVAHTTLADVARAVLENWRPEDTKPTGARGGDELPRDPSGTRITQRGHRKFDRPAKPAIPERRASQADRDRAEQVLDVLDRAVQANNTSALVTLNEARRVITREDLRDVQVGELTLHKHWQRAKRQLLKPVRFTMAEEPYQRLVSRLATHDTTITRALEVGLERFARTGKY